MLLCLLDRKRLHQPRQRHPLWLSPIQDRLHEIRRQQRQSQQPADAGGVGRTLGGRALAPPTVLTDAPRMVRPGLLDNASVRAWLGGVEPVWTLLERESFLALRLASEPPDGALRLAMDLLPAEMEKSPVVRNTRHLLRAASTKPGLKLTATGNLSRSVVLEMCDAFSWPGFDKAEAFRLHKVVNEPDFFPLFFLRNLAEACKLLRRRGGFLRITPAGKTVLDTQAQQALEAMLFHVALWHLDLSANGRGLPRGWPQREVGLVVWCLSIAAKEWETRERLTRMCTIPVNGVLDQAWDISSHATEAQILRPLWWFGLLDYREEPVEGSRFEQQHFYRKTPLFDRFLSFKVQLDPMEGMRH